MDFTTMANFCYPGSVITDNEFDEDDVYVSDCEMEEGNIDPGETFTLILYIDNDTGMDLYGRPNVDAEMGELTVVDVVGETMKRSDGWNAAVDGVPEASAVMPYFDLPHDETKVAEMEVQVDNVEIGDEIHVNSRMSPFIYLSEEEYDENNEDLEPESV